MSKLIKNWLVKSYRTIPLPIRCMKIFELAREIVPYRMVEMFLEVDKKSKKELTLEEWENIGKPVPPPHIVKQQVIASYQKQYQYKILVETGTYLGDMVIAQRNNFEKIYSVELKKNLYKISKKRAKPYPHINIIEGDSGVVLKKLVP